MAITLAAARLGAILGNIIFGVFVDVACAVPILLVAVLLMGKLILLFSLSILSHHIHYRRRTVGIIST